MAKKRRNIGRWIALCLVALALVSVIAMTGRALQKDKGSVDIPDYTLWDEEVVEIAAGIPLQDGGRVKPFTTLANFTLLSMHGSRSISFSSGEEEVTLSPTEWMLDLLFRPEFAIKQPTFRVDNSDIVEAIGIEAKERRDRYSYEVLDKHSDELIRFATEVEDKKNRKEDLTPFDRQIYALGKSYRSYQSFLFYFTFIRQGMVLPDQEGEGQTTYRTSDILKNSDLFISEVRKYTDPSQMPRNLVTLITELTTVANNAKYGLFLFPPAERGAGWKSTGEVINDTASGQIADPEQGKQDVIQMENLFIATQDKEKDLVKELTALKASIVSRIDGAEYETDTLLSREKKVALEKTYFDQRFFLKALIYSMLAFVLLCFMWLAGGSKVGKYLGWGVWVVSLVSFTYLMIGIVYRGFIMGRFPIGNLFETIPFITGCAAFVAILVEVLTRRRIFLSLVPIVCMSGLFLARAYELSEQAGGVTDNMDPLVAVLNSNFWLSTHVFTIVSGYGAGIITGIISFVYLMMRMLGLDEGDKRFRRLITRAAYGCVCFTLFLSLIGTVLGGIWANDSWGRFWGWDPKENGALMIVLWSLFILHARLGGHLKEYGIHVCNIFGIAIIIFSWWHVNILGVGLHSYGFADENKAQIVWVSYKVIGSILAVSGIYYFFEKPIRAWMDAGLEEAPPSLAQAQENK